MPDGLTRKERAAEIAGQIVVAMVTPGGHSGASWTLGEDQGKNMVLPHEPRFKRFIKMYMALCKKNEMIGAGDR